MKNQKFHCGILQNRFIFYFSKKKISSLCGGPQVMENIFLFSLSLLLLQNLCNLPQRFLSVHSSKNYKNLCCPLIHSLWHNKRNKNFSFSHKTSSLCVVGPVMYFPFLSLSLSSLCVIYPRGRSVHSSKRVTTGPNGLQHNGLERVPTGSNGFDGGGRKGQ